MWTVPTITIRFPSNVPSTIGHNVTAAIAMATPIAHKGAVAGAKAVAMTVLDLMTTPKLIADAKTYFNTVQQKDQKYDPVLTAADKPAIDLNTQLMAQMRPQMEKFYYDPAKVQQLSGADGRQVSGARLAAPACYEVTPLPHVMPGLFRHPSSRRRHSRCVRGVAWIPGTSPG